MYFHVTAAGAAPLVGACTRALNAAAVPFVLKVVDRPGGFTRCDAAVLYVDPDALDRARPTLAEIVARVCAHLRDETPAFTKRLAPASRRGTPCGPGHELRRAALPAVAEGAVSGARPAPPRSRIASGWSLVGSPHSGSTSTGRTWPPPRPPAVHS